jgi:hypothetical protein
MNWFEHCAEDLAALSSPAELAEALRGCQRLDKAAQEKIDFVLIDWIMLTISRPADLEGVLELHKICRRARNLLGDQPLEQAMAMRWQGFADVLEAKNLAIRWAKSEAEAGNELLHEPIILRKLAEGEMRQSEFIELLQLSAGRVSQILAALEVRRKISRAKRGKESWVSLLQGESAARPIAEPVAIKTRVPAQPPFSQKGEHGWGCFAFKAA